MTASRHTLATMSKRTIRGIDDDLWRRVRVEAARRDMTVQALVAEALERIVKEGDKE